MGHSKASSRATSLLRWCWLTSLALLVSTACGDDGTPTDTTSDGSTELQDAADLGPDDADLVEEGVSDGLDDEETGPLVVPETIPTAEEWMNHLNDEILPYWTMEDALGDPVGSFPTFRCDDGSVFDRITHPCSELAHTDSWITDHFGRQYVRMMSRQTYLYGAAYHLTGDERLFELHQLGTDYLRAHALDPEGGAYSWFESDGTPAPPRDERTSQDLAYANVGLAMNYYLTRDPEVLDDILSIRDTLFEEYWDDDLGMLRWTPANPGNEQELVAQLDQINAYLLLLSRVVPETMETEWNQHLTILIEVLLDDFYDEEHNLFWGAITTPGQMTVGSFHTDFGHTIKSLWMIYLSGRILGDSSLVDFASAAAIQVFDVAYQTSSGAYAGTWAEKLTGMTSPAVWPGTEWWSYIELDQTAATLAMSQPDLLSYLETTYPRYFERMVDPEHGGVYHFVRNENEVLYAKAHLWKNGYHEVEHVVVGYLTGQGFRDQPADLYFAFCETPATDTVVPYVFDGTEVSRVVEPFEAMPGFQRTRVVFSDLH